MTHVVRFNGSHAKIATLTTVLAACGMAHGQQWTVINLHPAGALNSEARGVDAGQQVGVADNAQKALLWIGSSPSRVTLNPLPEGASSAQGVANGTQSGTVSVLSVNAVGSFSHAARWNGSAQSWIDMHPADPGIVHSNVLAMDAVSQVGSFLRDGGGGTFSAGLPCMWSGTSDSWIDLTPIGFASGEVRGVSSGQQVGATFDNFFGAACLWHGTADSFVNLQPESALFSTAQCTDGTHQYGVIGVLEPVTGLFPCQWTGTADSFVLFDVDDPSTRWGEIHATHGGWQVGYTTDNDGVSNARACLWTGTPNSFLDLNQFISASYNGSNALGIWRHDASGTTYVVGYADNIVTAQREAVMWVSGPGVNLITSPSAPTNCSAGAGGSLTYITRVLNAGADASGPITLTVDLPPAAVATYSSATPVPSIVTPTQLVFNLSPLAALGDSIDVSITLTAVGSGQEATITATASSAGESDPTNNSASATTRIEPPSPASAAATALISTNAALANSLIPGGAGRFTTLNHPFASPSGTWWVMNATTDQAATLNSVLVRTQTNAATTIVAQKGVTTTSNGTVTFLQAGAEVNDAGVVAFSGNDNGPGAANTFIATTSGGPVNDAAREGQPIPGIPGFSYGSNVGNSASIFANGQTGFSTNSAPAGANAYLAGNGANVIAQIFVTVPSGATDPVGSLLLNSTGVWGLALDSTGAHSIYQANLSNEINPNVQVIVADGAVVMQGGATVLPGLATEIDSANKYLFMGPSGTWLVRGTNIDVHEDWVARGSGSTINQVIKAGDPIFPSAVETWAEDPTYVFTFFAHVADGAGNYVIGGMTDNPDSFSDSVLVYNNQLLVARENDPVDLDGDGLFNDDAYIRSFDSDSVAILSNAVLAVVTLRDSDAALCHENNTNHGQALVRFPIGCTADFNHSGTVNSQDFFDFLPAFFTAAPSADVNHDGVINSQDFFDFLTAFFNGC